MINYDSVFNLSSDVTCNWGIQLDALQSMALKKTSRENHRSKKITNIELYCTPKPKLKSGAPLYKDDASIGSAIL